MSAGIPGAHVICSTGAFLAIQALALTVSALPVALSTAGVPLARRRGILGIRASTLPGGQKSPLGMKMNSYPCM